MRPATNQSRLGLHWAPSSTFHDHAPSPSGEMNAPPVAPENSSRIVLYLAAAENHPGPFGSIRVPFEGNGLKRTIVVAPPSPGLPVKAGLP